MSGPPPAPPPPDLVRVDALLQTLDRTPSPDITGPVLEMLRARTRADRRRRMLRRAALAAALLALLGAGIALARLFA